MIIGPNEAPETQTARITIIGSGPAGLALAFALEKAGLDVLLVESGLQKPDAFATELSAAASVPDNHVPPQDLGNRRLGGASWTWGGRCVAFDPVDFEPRGNGRYPGWPISHEEAMRTAGQAAEFLGIGVARFKDSPAEQFDNDGLSVVLERWCAEPQSAKRHRAALRASRSIRVQLGLTVIRIGIDADGRANTVEGRLPDGRSLTVKSDAVIVAAGGIESARLLLWSFALLPDHACPRWLGRGYMGHMDGSIATVSLSDPVKRYLDYFYTDGPCYARRRLIFKPDVIRREGLPNIGFTIDNPPYRNAHHRSAALSAVALGLSVPGLSRLVISDTMRAVLLGPALTRAALSGHVYNVLRNPLGAAFYGGRSVLGRFRRPVRPGIIETNRGGIYRLKYHAEQAPHFESRIALDEEHNAHGVPKVRIMPYISNEDIEGVIRAHEIVNWHLSEAGIGHIVYTSPPGHRFEDVSAQCGDGYHQIGTARMGKTAQDSVVDTNARVHGTQNVFVAGSAVFPTAGQANPTFMIVSEAYRLAEHLAVRYANG